MPLIPSDLPSDVNQTVQAALQHFAALPESRLHALEGTKPAELQPTSPHAVFNLGLSDLTAGRALASAQSTGWRFLLRQGDQIVASAETVANTAGGAQFSHFNSGPFVESTATAIATAAGLAQTKDMQYEQRLLHIPALYTMALWLHSNGDNDLLIPLAPTPDGIEPNRAYPAEELLGILSDKARQIPQMEPGDRRGG